MNILKFLDELTEERERLIHKPDVSEKGRYYVVNQMFIALIKVSEAQSDSTIDDFLYTLGKVPIEGNLTLKDKLSHLSFPETGCTEIFKVPTFSIVIYEDSKQKDLIIRIIEAFLSDKENWQQHLDEEALQNLDFYKDWLDKVDNERTVDPTITIEGCEIKDEHAKVGALQDFLRKANLSSEGRLAAYQFISRVADEIMSELLEGYLQASFENYEQWAEKSVDVNWMYDEFRNICCKSMISVLFEESNLNINEDSTVSHDPALFKEKRMFAREPDLEATSKILLLFENNVIKPKVDSLTLSGKASKISPFLKK